MWRSYVRRVWGGCNFNGWGGLSPPKPPPCPRPWNYASFRAHVRIASRIVSYRSWQRSGLFNERASRHYYCRPLAIERKTCYDYFCRLYRPNKRNCNVLIGQLLLLSKMSSLSLLRSLCSLQWQRESNVGLFAHIQARFTFFPKCFPRSTLHSAISRRFNGSLRLKK